MDKIAVQKELMKGDTVARLSHYKGGSLYYRVAVDGRDRVFPVPVVEGTGTSLVLSADLGDTVFAAEERAALLFRWISKAIDAGELLDA